MSGLNPDGLSVNRTFGETEHDSVNADVLSNAHYATSYEGANGGEQIQNAIDAADIESGANIIVVDGEGPDDVSTSSGAINDASLSESAWEIPTAITVPDNTTIVLDSCYLFLSDGADDNVIHNSDLSSGNENISITGVGRPIIDGNGDNQTEFDRETGDSFLNLGVRFLYCNDLTFGNVKIRHANCAGLMVGGSTDVTIENYRSEMVGSHPNQDGMHIVACENVNVDGYTGQSGDDSISVACANGNEAWVEAEGDCSNINISNVTTNTNGHRVIRCYANFGTTTDYLLTDVNINNVACYGKNQYVVSLSISDTKDIRRVNISNVAGDDGASGIDLAAGHIFNISNVVADGNAVDVNGRVIGGAINSVGSKTGNALNVVSRMDWVTASDIISHGEDGGPYATSALRITGRIFHCAFSNIRAVYSDYAVNISGSSQRAAMTIEGVSAFLQSDAPGTVINAPDQLDSNEYTTEIKDIVVRDAETILNIGAGVGCIVSDLRDYDATTIYGGVGDAKFTGDMPPIDVTTLANVETSEAYNDGTTGTAGPAFNDGTGWTSLVDGTAIN